MSDFETVSIAVRAPVLSLQKEAAQDNSLGITVSTTIPVVVEP